MIKSFSQIMTFFTIHKISAAKATSFNLCHLIVMSFCICKNSTRQSGVGWKKRHEWQGYVDDLHKPHMVAGNVVTRSFGFKKRQVSLRVMRFLFVCGTTHYDAKIHFSAITVSVQYGVSTNNQELLINGQKIPRCC